jgi:hypothetical protein
VPAARSAGATGGVLLQLSRWLDRDFELGQRVI